MIYIVLGMHKSGTTLVSKLLHHSGINMVDRLEQGSYEESGYYERETTYQMNLKLLGIPSDSLELHPAPKVIQMNSLYQQEIQQLISKYSQDYRDWGFKDPRTCLVYEAWRQHLPEHKIVVIYRSVEKLWSRYKYRGLKFWKNLSRAILLVQRWCEYNQSILNILSITDSDYIVLSYAEIMDEDGGYQHLQDFLERDMVDMREKSRKPNSNSNLLLTTAKWFVWLKTNYRYNHILCELDTHHSRNNN